MLTLPPDARFDSWRSCGADIPWARAQALASPALPPGQTEVLTRRMLSNEILRGAVDTNGKRLTAFTFPKSLYDLYGKKPGWSSGDLYGYSWRDGFISGAPGTVNILMDLDFIGADVPVASHHQEKGWNVICATDPTATLILINCGFYNFDSAVVLGGTHSHAVNLDLGVKGTKRTAPLVGHYGVRLVGQDNVVEGLNATRMSYHDVSTQNTRHCVYKDIVGFDVNLDFHAWGNDEQDDDNLYLNVNVGKGTRPFKSGGSASNLPWTGDNATFATIRKGDGSLMSKSAYPSWLHPVFIETSEVPPPPPPPPPTPLFPVGRSVTATTSLVIRSGPAKSFPQIGSQPSGAHGVVAVSEQLDSESKYVYVKVDFVSGVDGYCGIDKLT